MEMVSLVVSVVSMIAGIVSAVYTRAQHVQARRNMPSSDEGGPLERRIYWRAFWGDLTIPLICLAFLGGMAWLFAASPQKSAGWEIWGICVFFWLIMLGYMIAHWLDRNAGENYLKDPVRLRTANVANRVTGVLFVLSLILVVPALL